MRHGMEHAGAFLRDRAIGEIAATLPGASAVFREYRLDFCCGGDARLAEAAVRRGIDVGEIAMRLAALGGAAGADHPPDTDGLIAHIVRRYHERLRRRLPEVIRLAIRVEAVHRGDAAVPVGLAHVLGHLQHELAPHMQREQEVLFPVMRIDGGRPAEALIACSRREHERHGALVRELEALTGGLRAPSHACRSWQALCTGTAELVHGVIEHVHLENNVLFPRFERGEH